MKNDYRFISAPVVILISRFVVPKWMREKIINAVELLIAIEAHFVFFVSVNGTALSRVTEVSDCF